MPNEPTFIFFFFWLSPWHPFSNQLLFPQSMHLKNGSFSNTLYRYEMKYRYQKWKFLILSIKFELCSFFVNEIQSHFVDVMTWNRFSFGLRECRSIFWFRVRRQDKTFFSLYYFSYLEINLKKIQLNNELWWWC